MNNCQTTYNKDSSIPLGTENENSESDAELLEEENEDAKIDADTQASGNILRQAGDDFVVGFRPIATNTARDSCC